MRDPPLRAASALVGSSAPIRLICVFLLAAGPDALVGGLPGGGTGGAGRASGVAWLPSDVVPEVGHSGCLDHVRLLKRAPSQRRAIEEPNAGLQERRDQVDIQLIGRTAARYCRAVLPPPDTTTFLPSAARRARSRAAAGPPVTNVNVVPPCMTSGARG